MPRSSHAYTGDVLFGYPVMAVGELITAPRPAEQAPPGSPALRQVSLPALVFAAYLLIGVIAFWPLYGEISQRFFGAVTDYEQSVWFIGWVPHALAHGLNPFFSNALFVPTGVNLAQNTASPLLGLLTAPLVWLNPVAKANLLMVLAMPISATSAFVVLRKWRVWGPAAAIGGLIYGFSPYMVGQGLAHVELIFVPLPPFIAWTVASIVQRGGSPRRLGIQLGLLIAAQFLISPEVVATVAILSVAAVACVAIRRPSMAPEIARSAVVPLGISLVVVIVLLGYPLWMMVAGPQHFTGPTLAAAHDYPYQNDLLSFVVPGPMQRVSLGLGSLGSRLVSGNAVETGGYIGVPLLILAGILAWRSRRSSRMQLTAVLLFGSALLTLGPHLAVDGHLTGIPLPFLVLHHVPLLNDVLPARMSFEVGACFAAVIAFGLDDMRRGIGSDHHEGLALGGPRRDVVFACVTLAVLVGTQLPQWPYAKAPAVVLPVTIRRAVPPGDPVVMTYPYATVQATQPMIWQADDDYKFRLLGGYAFHSTSRSDSGPTVSPRPMNPPGLQQFLASQDGFNPYGAPPLLSPRLVSITRITLSRYDVRAVIVDRTAGGSGPVIQLFKDALGSPKASGGQFLLWADWHGEARHQVFPDVFVTRVVRPTTGAKLSGETKLLATVTDYLPVTSVEFVLTDTSGYTTLIAVGRLTDYGWGAEWNTTSLTPGKYKLRSLAYDAGGRSAYSTSIAITIPT